MEKLERHGCGPNGRVIKLDALDAALWFLRHKLLKYDLRKFYILKLSACQ